MALDHDRVMEILADALERTTATERQAYLNAACAGDRELRAEVDRLLSRQQQAETVMGDDKLAADWVPDTAFALSTPKPADEKPADRKNLVGSQVGPFQITSLLGEGGMGVVYRARDLRLNRDVAIKALPAAMAARPGLLARFAREAKLLASLSHPNVATVHGLEETPAGRFLVMELVDGETLADRLSRGAMAVDEAIRVGIQVADGLTAAHDAGLVHRDVKPGNVMITRGGIVKVLDFGLARTAKSPGDAPSGNTITAPHEILGTPRFMSPEQLRAEPVDKRTDVFAFGCLLYECLSARPAFSGVTVAAVVSSVLEDQPIYDALPPAVPDALRRLLMRCLAKDRNERTADLRQVRVELEQLITATDERGVRLSMPEPQPGPRKVYGRAHDDECHELPQSRWPAWASGAGMLALVAGCSALFTVMVMRTMNRPSSTPPVTHVIASPTPPSVAVQPLLPPVSASGRLEQFALSLPTPQADLARFGVAVSPDGSAIAIAAADAKGQRQLFIRQRGELAFRPVAGTADCRSPSFSPDGNTLAAIQNGQTVKWPVAGGSDTPMGAAYAAGGAPAWLDQRTLLVVPWRQAGFFKLLGFGISPQVVARPDTAKNQTALAHPHVSPDRRSVIYTARNAAGELSVERCELDGTGRMVLATNAAGGRVVQTPAGLFLLYVRPSDAALLADAIDGRGAIAGKPRVIAEGVAFRAASATAHFDVGDDGTLVYLPGGVVAERNRLLRVQPGGARSPGLPEAGAYAEPWLSTDGSVLSVVLNTSPRRAATIQLGNGLVTPVRAEGDVVSAAVSPDGKTLAYSPAGGPAIFLRDLAAGSETRLGVPATSSPRDLAWAQDGRSLWFSAADSKGKRQIMNIRLDGSAGPTIAEAFPVVRPMPLGDSGLLAYVSETSSGREIVVRSTAAAADSSRTPVGAGDEPRFNASTAALVYRQGNRLMSAQLNATGRLGAAEKLMDRAFGQSDPELSNYAVTPDGGLLLIEPATDGDGASALRVVQNWWLLGRQ